ncbi:rhodanese-like domain-containing protein [Cohnella cholangitidis]|uniref:Rhodanese-like domain-containing protein n=1 Tax=Cohnella cholangitidis TaxID=2598458 RepID=A0A7G5BTN5_9BACL|nr:rhodanese-like domain-containing protein [Cohnella cholangitidis]QMV40319.1 rhodanese-like domain-containing protein [Cohnella cholangitidis]
MSSYATITVEQLKSRLEAGEQIHLIDVREEEEVAQGMIPGALHLPLGQVPQQLESIPKEEEVIFICRSGYRSDQACQYLSSLGYKGATNLIGGMLAWNQLP